MEYVDFEVRIRSAGREGFKCEALISPVPASAAAFKPPLNSEQLERLLDAIGGDPPSWPSDLSPSPEALGEALYEALFSGKVAEAFHKSLAFVEGQGRTTGVRLWLRMAEAPELVPVAALPWELLRRPETRELLGRMREASILRFVETPRFFLPPSRDTKLRVLVVSSAPTSTPDLELGEEWAAIRSRLATKAVEVEILEHPTLRKFRSTLLGRGWHVLHFMGHGTFNDEGEATLYFEDDSGSAERITANAFAENLKGLEALRLVVLNACHTGSLPRRKGQDLFSSMAPAVLLAGIPAVVAMQLPVYDDSAIAFSEMFYERLAAGDKVDTAVSEGRLAVFNLHPDGLDWMAPALFVGSRDRSFFEIGPAAPPPVRMEEEKPRQALRLGIRSFGGPGSLALNMEAETDRMLPLESSFFGPDGRYIRIHPLWQEEVLPQVRDFLVSAASERGPVVLDLAAHASIAFAAGYCLGTKSGLDVAIRQRGRREIREMLGEPTPLPDEPLWSDEEDRPGSREAADVALAIGITNDVLGDVEKYLERTSLKVSRIITARLAPKPDPEGVRDGAHALHLAQSLQWKIKSRTTAEREGVLHVFASAPNAALFFLGQLCRGLGTIQLYEYDFHTGAPGAYLPSIRLPS
ncbi:MAG TPA: SAVED domain-containing protein [Thermoanaerobaculia bacterium]|jgi:hypothetical protein|nr:SAVED domain-containing protein [Thermoanaerobaculia bacterium]